MRDEHLGFIIPPHILKELAKHGNVSCKNALNEHFSDVFGAIIKQKYLKQDISEADWLIDDTAVTDTFPDIAI